MLPIHHAGALGLAPDDFRRKANFAVGASLTFNITRNFAWASEANLLPQVSDYSGNRAIA